MAGFEVTKYETDDGNIIGIRLSEDKFEVAGNPPPAGTTTLSIFAKISKSNREFGVRPRYVTLSREVTATIGGGDADAGNDESVDIKYRATLPILTSAVWEGNAFDLGAVVSYKEESWTVTGRAAEDY